jgi:hypothetical protein
MPIKIKLKFDPIKGKFMTVWYVCMGRFSVPTVGKECLEMLWSGGRACCKCPLETCYRNGWSGKKVREDNTKLVAEKKKRK